MESILGIAPIAWSNDDLPELGGTTPLKTCLSEARTAGFSGIEMGGKFPTSEEHLFSALDAHNLKLASGWYSGTLLNNSIQSEKRRIQSQLNLFKALNAPCIIYGETSDTIQNKRNVPLNHRRTLTGAELRAYSRRLDDFSKWCLDQELQLAFHHHMGTVIETETELDILVENSSDSLKLCFDTGHMEFAGGDPLRSVSNHSDRIAHFHCKDIRSEVVDKLDRSSDSFLDAVLKGAFTVPGDGDIDFAPILNQLFEHRYEGWFVVEAEQDPQKAPPLEYAQIGHKHLTDCLANVGYQIVSSLKSYR